MRKQFKKIMSAVLSAAMVLSLGTSTNLKTVSADDTTTGTTEEAGFTAMIGFQTIGDYDCRDSFDNYYYSVGQKYLEWLAEQDQSFDIAAHNEKQNGRNIYHNGAAGVNKKTLELEKPEEVMLDTVAVANDVKMTEDGTYKVSIENLDLTKNPDGSEDGEGRIFSMLYIAADIPLTDSIKVKASSVKIDGNEILTGEVELPQKKDSKKYVQAMLSDSYDDDGTVGVPYYGADEALNVFPKESIEIEFSISGVDWTSEKYEPKEYDFNPSESSGPSTGGGTEAPIESTGPIDIHEISKPFDIGLSVNVNDALTEEVEDAAAENGKVQASVFGTKDYWNLLQTDPTLLNASGASSYGEHQQTFYESETGSLHITKTGEYSLSVTALGDAKDLTGNGAIWLPLIPNQMPEDYNLVGRTITVGEKTYTWGGQLYADGPESAAKKSARLPVCNEWASEEQTDLANPVKDIIPVTKGDLITFTFAVTGDAPAQPSKTPTPTAPPASNSYNAYLGFQLDNWIYRDTWNSTGTGLDSKEYNYLKQIMVNGAKPVDATIKNAEIKQGVTQYDISISGVNLKTQKGGDDKGSLATKFNMLFISTDIPLTQKNVKCTNATLKIDGKVIKEYKTVPCKADANKYYQLMLANAYAPDDGTKNCEYTSGKELKIMPTSSMEVSFSISGVDFDKSTAGPEKGKTFTNGNFKYKVTKESQISASTKKVTTGKVALVGLSAKGKKAKKLKVPETVKQKKGKFKVVKMTAGALKKANATAITLNKSIKALPANAFKDCNKLKKLTLNAKLSSVNKKAFTGCTKKITVAGKFKKQNAKKIKKVYKKAK